MPGRQKGANSLGSPGEDTTVLRRSRQPCVPLESVVEMAQNSNFMFKDLFCRKSSGEYAIKME